MSMVERANDNDELELVGGHLLRRDQRPSVNRTFTYFIGLIAAYLSLSILNAQKFENKEPPHLCPKTALWVWRFCTLISMHSLTAVYWGTSWHIEAVPSVDKLCGCSSMVVTVSHERVQASRISMEARGLSASPMEAHA